jgi:hypothetical protein
MRAVCGGVSGAGDGVQDFHVMRWVGVYRVSCDALTMAHPAFLAILFWQNA